MKPAFQTLPVGAVKPLGWLHDQLRLQADGFTGLLPDYWPDVGDNSGWLGGSGEDWERGPYYCDGLVPLARLLDDAKLLARANRWVEWTLSSQRPDGFFGPTSNDDWWPRMVMLKVLAQSGDARVPDFMARYFEHQRRELPRRPLDKWGQARGAENAMFAPSGLAELIESQTLDWTSFFFNVPTSRVTEFSHYTHVVNVAMAVKEPALRWLRTGDERYRQAVYEGLANLDRYHGQPQGMFSGDEWLATRDPSQGVELCAVVELAFSLEQLVRIWGDVGHADRLERVVYNALPATITADMRGRQYDQQPNQVLCSVARRNWTQNKDDSNIFGLEPNFGCCTANLHQGWPKLVAHMWMAGDEDELVAVAYGPSVARHGGLEVRAVTDYPFDEEIRFEVKGSGRLALRVPHWCAAAEVNREPRSLAAGRFHRLRVSDGDVVELRLPASLRYEDRDEGFATAVHHGPLTFALRVGEEWRKIGREEPFADWEVHPATPWNYALVEREPLRLERRLVSKVPWSGEAPPLVLRGLGRRVPSWTLIDSSAGPTPSSPVDVDTPAEPIELIPYGCARLRVTEMPTTRT